MIFSENRTTPRIKCGAGFFRIMRVLQLYRTALAGFSQSTN